MGKGKQFAIAALAGTLAAGGTIAVATSSTAGGGSYMNLSGPTVKVDGDKLMITSSIDGLVRAESAEAAQGWPGDYSVYVDGKPVGGTDAGGVGCDPNAQLYPVKMNWGTAEATVSKGKHTVKVTQSYCSDEGRKTVSKSTTVDTSVPAGKAGVTFAPKITVDGQTLTIDATIKGWVREDSQEAADNWFGSSDLYLDGKLIGGSDRGPVPCNPNAPLRKLDTTFGLAEVEVAPGTHKVRFVQGYCGDGGGKTIDQTVTVDVPKPGAPTPTPTPTSTGSPSPTAPHPSEPPTPSPSTTRLGVTG